MRREARDAGHAPDRQAKHPLLLDTGRAWSTTMPAVSRGARTDTPGRRPPPPVGRSRWRPKPIGVWARAFGTTGVSKVLTRLE